jgi:hypothetical protein
MGRRQTAPGHLGDVAMMGKQNNLSHRGKICQHPDRCFRSPVVEVDQQVIANERQRFGRARIAFQRRQPQRQIELIQRPLTQPVGLAFGSVRTARCNNDVAVLFLIHAKPIIPAFGQTREYLTRPPK